MKFSICVPVYNVAPFLKECVDSILNQTFKDFEVIFVNDGSTDKSLEILTKLCKDRNQIQIINKPNQGLLWARRDAISKASGDYILFIDSDDKYSNENVLKDLNEYITKYNYPDLILFNRNQFPSVCPENKNKVFYSKEILFNKDFLCDIRYEFITRNYFNAMFLKCVKRQIVQNDKTDYSLFNPQMAEDISQSIEIFDKAKNIVYIPKVFYEYRINPTSITNAPLSISNLEKKMVRLLFSILNKKISDWELYSYKSDVYTKFYRKSFSFYCDRILELMKNNEQDETAKRIVDFIWFNEDNKFLNSIKTLKKADLDRGRYLLIKGVITKNPSDLISGYKKIQANEKRKLFRTRFLRFVKKGGNHA